MYFDGSLVKEGAGLGFVFISPLGVRMRYVVCVHFPASNNVAEYEAIVVVAKAIGDVINAVDVVKQSVI
jgi:hypothetical protein